MTIHNLDFLMDLCASGRKMTIAVACPYGDDALAAVCAARDRNLVNGVLVGDAARIRVLAEKDGLSLDGVEIVDEKADDLAVEKSVKMVSGGDADLLMKGLVKTATLLKSVLNKEWGLRAGSLLSHLFLQEITVMGGRIFGLTDGGMNMYPDLQTKVGIIENAVECYHKIGVACPMIAALAAVEVVNPDMACTLDAAALAKMSDRGQIKGCVVDGPFALDNAVSEESAKTKGIVSPVAGHADVMIVPNIDAGNMMVKALVYFSKNETAGLILGATAPVVLTSRADSPRAKLLSVAAAVALSAFQKK